MRNSKIVPVAFWVGFVALGVITSLGGPARPRADLAMRAQNASVVAQTERPAAIPVNVRAHGAQ